MRNILKVTKEEAVSASIMTLIFTVLQGFVIRHFFDAVAYRMHGNGSDFLDAMPVSGFDAYTYSMLVDWNVVYDIYRHPLIAFFFYPLYLLNQGLIWLTGINCAQFIVAAILLVGVFYSYIFMYRIFRELLGLCRFDAHLLSVMLYSFAYVMVSMLVPDHFGISMPLLIMVLYLSGISIKEKKRFTIIQTCLLFFSIAGVTLSNGAKVFLDVFFVNGKRFFRSRFLLLAVILPFAFLWCFSVVSSEILIERNREIFMKNDKLLRRQLYTHVLDTVKIKDSVHVQEVYKEELRKRIMAKYHRDHQYDHLRRKRVPLSNWLFLAWTDITIPRWQTLVDNFFGESLQLHRKNLLMNTFNGRPVFVSYYDTYNYVIEVLIVLLFAIGILCGRRSKFMWMCVCGFMLDVLIHVVIGFAIDEVYLVTAHWAFTLPVVYGYLLTDKRKWAKSLSRVVLVMLTTYLWIYNVSLLLDYVR